MNCLFCCYTNRVRDEFIYNDKQEHFTNSIDIIKKLGDGAFSTVYKIKYNNHIYSCKILKKEPKNKFREEIENLKKISKIKSNRFPVFYKGVISDNSFYILYKYIEGQDLYASYKRMLDDQSCVRYNVILEIIREITLGLFSLFKVNLVHLDIKMENIILLNISPVKIKIIDLQTCKPINKLNNYANNGTYGYLPPEIAFTNKYYHNSDIWSLGNLLYILLKGAFLFDNDKHFYLRNIKNFKSLKNVELTDIPSSIKELLTKMLVPIHTYRITIKQILRIDIIKNPELIMDKLSEDKDFKNICAN